MLRDEPRRTEIGDDRAPLTGGVWDKRQSRMAGELGGGGVASDAMTVGGAGPLVASVVTAAKAGRRTASRVRKLARDLRSWQGPPDAYSGGPSPCRGAPDSLHATGGRRRILSRHAEVGRRYAGTTV